MLSWSGMITAELLETIPLFASLSSQRRALVAELAADIALEPGEYVLHEGEMPSFFIVVDGLLEITKRVGAVERVLGTRGPGEYFGEVPLVLGTPAFANARAAPPSRVMRLDKVTFHELLAESPPLSHAVAQSMALRVGDMHSLAEQSGTADVTIVGRRWDAACHDLRDFLARNQVTFDWLEPADPALAQRVPEALPFVDVCPLVRVNAGTELLVQPSLREVACAIGLRVDPERDVYDVVIAGGGPAGLAAAVYGASEGLATLMVEREAPGGQAGTSSRIENYLGFPAGLSGGDLGNRALQQAQRLGAEIVVTRNVSGIDSGDGHHVVHLDDNGTLRARAVVIATGVNWRELPIEGIERFTGRGVYYGAARTEALATRGKDVFLIGGGNSAGQAAVYFADYARSVTLVIRGGSLEHTMSRYLVDQLEHKHDVRVLTNSEVVALEGDDHLRAITIRAKDGTVTRHETDALFVFIGADAETGWLPDAIIRDDEGYVLTGLEAARDPRAHWPLGRDPFLLETSVPRIFAAGDVRHGSVKRVAAAVGEGSMAIAFVHQALATETES
jgi:thioredoxin reductase (NADPH)